MIKIISEFSLKTKIFSNQGSLEQLKNVVGTKALIVADKVMEKNGYLDLVIGLLSEANIKSVVFSEITPDPDTKVITSGLKIFNKINPDVLIAIGGGSAIDAAKAIMYSVKQLDQVGAHPPYFIAIPSTSGTGSEVTDFSVITVEEDKICIVDALIAPDLAILDPSCIENVPNRVVVDTGIDVLVHATEAYVSINATDFTDAFVEKTIRILFEHLPVINEDISNVESRTRVHNASCMAGIAFNNAGLGITHSLSHAIGARFHIAHGRCNAMLMESVIEYNGELNGKADNLAARKYSRLAKILGLPARTTREGMVSYIEAIRKLKRRLGVESGFEELGIESEKYYSEINTMAAAAQADRCTPTNPKKPTNQDLAELYKKSF